MPQNAYVLQVFSNNVYKSMEHRVLAPQRVERFSVAFFYCPSYDAVIQSYGKPTMYRKFSFREYKQQIQKDVQATGDKVGVSRFLLWTHTYMHVRLTLATGRWCIIELYNDIKIWWAALRCAAGPQMRKTKKQIITRLSLSLVQVIWLIFGKEKGSMYYSLWYTDILWFFKCQHHLKLQQLLVCLFVCGVDVFSPLYTFFIIKLPLIPFIQIPHYVI